MNQESAVLNVLEHVQSLRGFLKSEMSINEAVNGEVAATIKVYNDAPISKDAGDVVFVGVGLRIIDGKSRSEQRRINWPSKITKTISPPQEKLRKKYNEGVWFGVNSESRVSLNTVQDYNGDVLFPRESIEYQIKLLTDDLPYLDLRVEGFLSRRHLFHISQPMAVLKKWTQPKLVEIFSALDAIDYSSILSVIDKTPSFSPQTTIADIDAFGRILDKAIIDIKTVMIKISDIYKTVPNREIGEFLGTLKETYFLPAMKSCQNTLEVLSGKDITKMIDNAEEMKVSLVKFNELKHKQNELKIEFGIE